MKCHLVNSHGGDTKKLSDISCSYFRLNEFFSVQLTDEYSIHLINYEDKPHVLRPEVSLFFWDTDELRHKVSSFSGGTCSTNEVLKNEEK